MEKEQNKNGNNLENTNTISQNIITEWEKKLKELTKTFFKQIKFGCHRKFCYNSYCNKGNGK